MKNLIVMIIIYILGFIITTLILKNLFFEINWIALIISVFMLCAGYLTCSNLHKNKL